MATESDREAQSAVSLNESGVPEDDVFREPESDYEQDSAVAYEAQVLADCDETMETSAVYKDELEEDDVEDDGSMSQLYGIQHLMSDASPSKEQPASVNVSMSSKSSRNSQASFRLVSNPKKQLQTPTKEERSIYQQHLKSLMTPPSSTEKSPQPSKVKTSSLPVRRLNTTSDSFMLDTGTLASKSEPKVAMPSSDASTGGNSKGNKSVSSTMSFGNESLLLPTGTCMDILQNNDPPGASAQNQRPLDTSYDADTMLYSTFVDMNTTIEEGPTLEHELNQNQQTMAFTIRQGQASAQQQPIPPYNLKRQFSQDHVLIPGDQSGVHVPCPSLIDGASPNNDGDEDGLVTPTKHHHVGILRTWASCEDEAGESLCLVSPQRICRCPSWFSNAPLFLKLIIGTAIVLLVSAIVVTILAAVIAQKEQDQDNQDASSGNQITIVGDDPVWQNVAWPTAGSNRWLRRG